MSENDLGQRLRMLCGWCRRRKFETDENDHADALDSFRELLHHNTSAVRFPLLDPLKRAELIYLPSTLDVSRSPSRQLLASCFDERMLPASGTALRCVVLRYITDPRLSFLTIVAALG